MSNQIAELSTEEVNAVSGGGFYFPPLIDASTNISWSVIKQSNYTKVYGSSYVNVQQSNNVGTTIVIGG
jgi:hypothetical protein